MDDKVGPESGRNVPTRLVVQHARQSGKSTALVAARVAAALAIATGGAFGNQAGIAPRRNAPREVVYVPPPIGARDEPPRRFAARLSNSDMDKLSAAHLKRERKKARNKAAACKGAVGVVKATDPHK